VGVAKCECACVRACVRAASKHTNQPMQCSASWTTTTHYGMLFVRSLRLFVCLPLARRQLDFGGSEMSSPWHPDGSLHTLLHTCT
jgi:hypothetical protein